MSRTKREIERLREQGTDPLAGDDLIDDEFWYEAYRRQEMENMRRLYEEDQQAREELKAFQEQEEKQKKKKNG